MKNFTFTKLRALSLLTAAVVLVSVCWLGCGDSGTNSGGGSGGNNRCGTDGTAKLCKTVDIGGQTWMAENLNYKTGNSWCAHINPFESGDSYCKKYGRLYDWSTAKRACPSGWHLPSREEFERLLATVGNDNNEAGTKLMAATSDWLGGGGTDDYGFAALPGGMRLPSGIFNGYPDPYAGGWGALGFWWSSTAAVQDPEYDPEYDGEAYRLAIECVFGLAYVGYGTDKDNGAAYSVRCLRDETSSGGGGGGGDNTGGSTWTGAPNNCGTDGSAGSCKTVVIGGKKWMAENLNYATDSSWCYNDSDSYCKKYGRLYAWNAAKIACPTGWHLPSRREWGDLAIAAGGTGTYGAGVSDTIIDSTPGKKLCTTSGWNSTTFDDGFIYNHNGTDAYGFSALPGGFRDSYGRFINGAGDDGYWWTATEYASSDSAYFRRLGWDDVTEWYANKANGNSVRCVAD